MTLTFTAIGRARPQGSKRHVGRGILIEAANLKPWRDTVTAAAIGALDGADPIEGPVSVGIAVAIARPAGHYGSGRNAQRLKPSAPTSPTGRNTGDVDKLARAILDACTVARVWLDDSQVDELRVTKFWGERGEREYAVVSVSEETR